MIQIFDFRLVFLESRGFATCWSGGAAARWPNSSQFGSHSPPGAYNPRVFRTWRFFRGTRKGSPITGLSFSIYDNWNNIPNIHMSVTMPIYLSVTLPIYLSLCPFICLSLCPFICLSLCPFIYLSLRSFICLSLCPFICMSLCLFICQFVVHSVR